MDNVVPWRKEVLEFILMSERAKWSAEFTLAQLKLVAQNVRGAQLHDNTCCFFGGDQ